MALDEECRCDGGFEVGERTVIPAGKSFDEGKKGPWFKFDSWEQARRVLRYLPAEHGHPQVMAFVEAVRKELEAHDA